MQAWRAAGLPLTSIATSTPRPSVSSRTASTRSTSAPKCVVRAGGGGRGPTSLVQIRGHDRRRSGPPKEHRDQQADDALAGHEDRFSEPGVGVEHHRDRRLEVRGEHPDVGWEPVGQADRKVGRHDVLGLMRMVHEDEVVHRQLGDARADLDHAADARVART